MMNTTEEMSKWTMTLCASDDGYIIYCTIIVKGIVNWYRYYNFTVIES